jgi:hypothetical protein
MRSILKFAALLAAFVVGAAHAQYPQRPIQLIVPWGAGGGTDATARIIGASEPGRSERAGAVTVRLLEGRSALVMEKLNQLPTVGKCSVLSESPVTVRAYLKKNGERGELARAIGEVAPAVSALENVGTAEARFKSN